jgi:hypothetical protein
LIIGAAVPRVSSFFGIDIYIFFDDHPVPHFHAQYQGEEVTIRIVDLSVLAGSINPRAMGLVVEWATRNRAQLARDWELAEQHLPLVKIPGLR